MHRVMIGIFEEELTEVLPTITDKKYKKMLEE